MDNFAKQKPLVFSEYFFLSVQTLKTVIDHSPKGDPPTPAPSKIMTCGGKTFYTTTEAGFHSK